MGRVKFINCPEKIIASRTGLTSSSSQVNIGEEPVIRTFDHSNPKLSNPKFPIHCAKSFY